MKWAPTSIIICSLCFELVYNDVTGGMNILYSLGHSIVRLVRMKCAPTRQRPFVKTKEYVWHRIKIMWEEQLVDPPIDHIASVNVP